MPQQNSNLELYRIVCMLMIVAHHYVVNSGMAGENGVLANNPHAANTIYYWLFGMWGKTGINCFMLITGYFMCKSQITLRKFMKLMLEVYLYKIVIFAVFLACGYEQLSAARLMRLAMPVWGFYTNFVGCFIGFWLLIPFLNILIRSMTQRQHLILTGLLLTYYTLLAQIPHFTVTFNYITWFGVLYLIASYARLYPHPLMEKRALWGWLTIASIGAAMLSVGFFEFFLGRNIYFLVADSNAVLAVAVALTSFLWMKNLPVPQSKWVNRVGGSTFGVLLIHANSDAMRQWLWNDVVDCVGHYDLPPSQTIAYSAGTVAAIFTVCVLIDRLRIRLLEEPLFKWIDRKEYDKIKS